MTTVEPFVEEYASNEFTDNFRKRRCPDEQEEHVNKYQRLDDNTKVVATHYNEIEEKGLKERFKSRIFHMRNFNNWIKTMLIDKYLNLIREARKLGEPIRVLDMCCGKGGDLFKWEKGGITHLICTDIAQVSVEQCEARYNALASRNDNQYGAKKFSAEFFACDSTLVRLREKYQDPSMKLNLVNCQFAFHYCFESLSQAECMVRNAAECLLPGGFFIATIPDAYEIMRRQREAQSKQFGNEVYNIEFICDAERPPLFGAKYKFHLEGVVDCPEFLVHFPTLVELCKKYGLKLVEKETFADFYKQSVSVERGKNLLTKMQALETFPPEHVEDLSGKETDYKHAQEYLGMSSLKNPYDGETLGTLSMPEWEAITLYLVCAFRKCKNTWNSEGKPVYELTS